MIIARRFERDRRRGFGGWSIGVAAMVLVSASIFPSVKGDESFDDLINDLPESIKALVGSSSVPFSTAAGYLNGRLFASLAPLLLVIYAISLGTRALGASEEDGTLELLLANPVTRGRVYAERGTGALVLLAGLTAMLFVSVLVLGPLFGLLDGVSIPGLAAASGGAGMLGLLFGSLAFCVGALTGRRSTALAVATVAAVATYLLYSLSAVGGAAHSLRFVTPWYWYLSRNMLVDGVPLEPFLAPLAVTAIFVAVGAVRFAGRDLR